jgi:hypothetical protein
MDRRQLEAIISDRSAPQKHVWRATIILATAEGCGTGEIMRRSGKSKPVVWRRQARFMAGAADEAGSRRNDDARLQAAWYHHAVPPQHPRWHRHRPQHAAPSAPGIHPLPQYDRGAGPCGKRDSTQSSTITPPTNIQRCGNGWRDILAGPSTSPRPRHPGSTRSKGSSPSSRASGSSAAYSSPSLTCNSPSTASSPIPTPTPNPLFGRPIQNASSPLSNAGSNVRVDPVGQKWLSSFATATARTCFDSGRHGSWAPIAQVHPINGSQLPHCKRRSGNTFAQRRRHVQAAGVDSLDLPAGRVPKFVRRNWQRLCRRQAQQSENCSSSCVGGVQHPVCAWFFPSVRCPCGRPEIKRERD